MVPDDASSDAVDTREYRRVIARFATGVSVVVTRGDGIDVAMTVNSLTSVSLDPVLVLFCVEKTARFLAAVLAAKVWTVSILSVEGEAVSRWFATRGRPLEAPLEDAATRPGPATGLPLFDDAVGWLECRTFATHDAGDHVIVIGEVLAVEAAPGEPPPLLYYESGYRGLPG